jgi:hypothetical protein
MAANANSEVVLTLSVPTGVRVLSSLHAAFTGTSTNFYFRAVEAPAISTAWLVSNSLNALGNWNGGVGMNTADLDFGSVSFSPLTSTVSTVIMQYQQAPSAGYYSVVTLGWTEFL